MKRRKEFRLNEETLQYIAQKQLEWNLNSTLTIEKILSEHKEKTEAENFQKEIRKIQTITTNINTLLLEQREVWNHLFSIHSFPDASSFHSIEEHETVELKEAARATKKRLANLRSKKFGYEL